MNRTALELIRLTLDPPRGRAWHGGPTPCGAVRGVSAALAHWRPAPGRKSIWELTLHIAYWKYAVRRHLEPGPIPRFPRSPANWPAAPGRADAAQWDSDRRLLLEQHELFSRAAARFDPARLQRRPARKRTWTYGQMIIGILAHDAYHAGQIQMLKRLWRNR
jgi:hypothetical protein